MQVVHSNYHKLQMEHEAYFKGNTKILMLSPNLT